MTKRVTKRQAEAVLRAVQKQYAGWVEEGYGPKLVMDWRYLSDEGQPAIVWEEGPYEWSYRFPYGGVEEETTALLRVEVPDAKPVTVPKVELPKGVWVESATSWALSIYPE